MGRPRRVGPGKRCSEQRSPTDYEGRAWVAALAGECAAGRSLLPAKLEASPFSTVTSGFDIEEQPSTSPVPRVTTVTPDEGPDSGGSTVTITGSHLEGATRVRFGTAEAPGFTVDGESQIEAVVPPGSGSVAVTVTTPVGTSQRGETDFYQYLAPPPPTVTRVRRKHGPPAGGTEVTVTGEDFVPGATTVSFGNTVAPHVTVHSAESLTATAPAGRGRVDVTVTTPGGTSAVTRVIASSTASACAFVEGARRGANDDRGVATARASLPQPEHIRSARGRCSRCRWCRPDDRPRARSVFGRARRPGLREHHGAFGRNKNGGFPPPVVGVTLRLPSGTALNPGNRSTCSKLTLEQAGPSACAKSSEAGPVGRATGIVSFGSERVEETATLQSFFAPGGGLNFFLNGHSPVSLEILASATVAANVLSIEVPLVSTVPGAPFASLTEMEFRLGDTRPEEEASSLNSGLILPLRMHGSPGMVGVRDI